MCIRLHFTLLRKRSFEGEKVMNDELALWLLSLFIIVPALMYAALVIYDMKKREQKEKKS